MRLGASPIPFACTRCRRCRPDARPWCRKQHALLVQASGCQRNEVGENASLYPTLQIVLSLLFLLYQRLSFRFQARLPDTRLVLLTGRFHKYLGETTYLTYYISNVCANFSHKIHYDIIDRLFFKQHEISMRVYVPSCSHLRIRSLIETLFGLIFRASFKNLNAAGTLLDLYSTNAFAMKRESIVFLPTRPAA